VTSSQREGRANELDLPALEDFAKPLGISEGFFESGGEHEHEDARRLVADAEKGVGHSTRQVHERTPLGPEPLVTANEVDRSVEDVEGLVLVAVDVERGAVAAGDGGLDEPESTRRVGTGSLDIAGPSFSGPNEQHTIGVHRVTHSGSPSHDLAVMLPPQLVQPFQVGLVA